MTDNKEVIGKAKQMRAVRYHSFGETDVLQVEQAPVPQPGAGEVLVRIHAAGVLPVDWKIRRGMFPMPVQFPHIPGTAFAGVITAVGEGVSGWQIGQSVFGRSTKGTYAEYTTASEEELALKPASISYEEASSLSGGATTAWRALVTEGQVKPNERVLIHGAAGGVGMFAVQFAKWRGAEVFATAGQANKAFVASLGADHVIDYTSECFEDIVKDADFVLDTLGGETLARTWAVLKRGGRLASIAGQPPVDMAKQHGIALIRAGIATKTDLSAIAELIDEGKLTCHIEQSFTMEEVRQAHEKSQTGPWSRKDCASDHRINLSRKKKPG
ncbi:NADP-dependent oxidoreductase [Paenibacillus qinlingensis]|uniref:NADPH:quinone reductase-like Zn-dependent oxidoreductase n=1 Tax=Paenibacillus qinlingensis TaxID=1837343 RepID=A0ABU1NQ86_9BACL|nr:NADP-dependent oxidoreductase [Paenibacillus qinlingensis]MDR6549583.1 NADPH:quinone reductase-like Zn-dependent oxidoreductase [Paenibacillus qinlingensis]